MAFNPTAAERDPTNWNPDQQQVWKAHLQEQAAKGMPPYDTAQFMLVHHNKFGLEATGERKPVPAAPAPAAEPARLDQREP